MNLLNNKWIVQIADYDIHLKAFMDAAAVLCVVAIFVMIFSIIGSIGVFRGRIIS